MRQVIVRGKYVATDGILTYKGESTTVPVPVIPPTPEEDGIKGKRLAQERNDLIARRKQELKDHPAKQQEVDEAAARQTSENFFFRREFEQLDFYVEEVPDYHTGLHSTAEFESLVDTLPEDDED